MENWFTFILLWSKRLIPLNIQTYYINIARASAIVFYCFRFFAIVLLFIFKQKLQLSGTHSFTTKCNMNIQWLLKGLENKLNIYSRINNLVKFCSFISIMGLALKNGFCKKDTKSIVYECWSRADWFLKTERDAVCRSFYLQKLHVHTHTVIMVAFYSLRDTFPV